MYKLNVEPILGTVVGVIRLLDTAYIPFDPANTDYQAFLKHQAEGVKVYAADETIPEGEAE